MKQLGGKGDVLSANFHLKEPSKKPTVSVNQVTPQHVPNYKIFEESSTKSDPKFDYLNGYITLVALLIMYESNKTSEKSLIGIPIEIGVLPIYFQWLLNQFAAFYGVGEVFQKIAYDNYFSSLQIRYFEMLAQSFDHTDNHLTSMLSIIHEIVQMVVEDFSLNMKEVEQFLPLTTIRVKDS
jgi:hypothetical protein